MDLATLDVSKQQSDKKPQEPDNSMFAWIAAIDMKYQTFLYLVWYTVMSLLGHYNNFFFACHLLDIAMGVKTLRTILSSVTHNGKQLMMTVGLLAVVVYLYTVVAFNFFRKFYNKSEDEDEPDMKCDDMMTCYLFHMYVGVRAGGVSVMRLKILQVMSMNFTVLFRHHLLLLCHRHSAGHHSGFNYRCFWFFLMYLINKEETEHTGQESYVWKMYQERCWDFFPAGDCFRKQYEDQLG
ncbi:hypothetical protein Q7C36_019650 [Tachysurus vachellii]|uniref:Ion transport domain-containing protein n=1 Tax=Tachysurus vachellii TaxID=175792 RepID=A0AA88RWM0_TACVA|nr:hypothetical protein Q7C36_019650 [Tachysurus vachellii]